MPAPLRAPSSSRHGFHSTLLERHAMVGGAVRDRERQYACLAADHVRGGDEGEDTRTRGAGSRKSKRTNRSRYGRAPGGARTQDVCAGHSRRGSMRYLSWAVAAVLFAIPVSAQPIHGSGAWPRSTFAGVAQKGTSCAHRHRGRVCAGWHSRLRSTRITSKPAAHGPIRLSYLTFAAFSDSRPRRADHDDHLRSQRSGDAGTGRQRRIQSERKIGPVPL
jgi:hypothetical protein